MTDDDKPRKVYEIGEYRTLPATFLIAKTIGAIPAFGSGRAELVYKDPQFDDPPFKYSVENLLLASQSHEFARTVVAGWSDHLSKVGYYLQFQDDSDGERMKSFHSHTELSSAILESRLNIPTTPLWETFQHLLQFKFVQEGYRKDKNRIENYEKHVSQLDAVNSRYLERGKAPIAIGRALQQIEIRAADWENLPSIHILSRPQQSSSVALFYSYCHRDENLRDELEKHLSILQRQGHIDQWHDRRIGAGEEWKGSIDEHLKNADLILLLISSDFLASDYCYDVELDLAMKRHEAKEAKVIPVFLRSCDWEGSRFASLQGLPVDARPVTAWPDRDEAFTSIAKGIRQAVIKSREARNSK